MTPHPPSLVPHPSSLIGLLSYACRLSSLVSLLSYACRLSSLAAVSPLATADDYTFTRPGVTNAVKGLVMGDAGDYGVMRHEDVAWLHEAAMERSVLAGKEWRRLSPANVTNRLEEVRTNSVPQSPYIAGPSFAFPAGDLLHPDCGLSTGIRVMRHADGTNNTTNDYVLPLWSWMTNRYYFATNFITQVMTNGTANTYTNYPAWSFYTSNLLEQVSCKTNRMSNADFCALSNITTIADTREWYRYEAYDGDYVITGPYAKTPMTNLYAIVRKGRRSLPLDAYGNPSGTNSTLTIYSEINGSPSTYTERNVDADYMIIVSCNKQFIERQFRGEHGWETIEGDPDTSTIFERESIVPDNLDMYFEAQTVADYAVTCNSDEPRVKTAHVFAVANVSYSFTKTAYHTTESGSGGFDVDTNGTLTASAMVYLGKATRRESTSGHLELELTADKSIYSRIAAACGVPYLSDSSRTDLPEVSEPQWYETSELDRRKETDQYSYEYLHIDLSDFYVVLNLSPSTKLSTWSEYE